MDWATASSLATAGGTLVLAVATFAAVRSSNRSARPTEQSLLAATRPLLLPSRPGDERQKVGFIDEHWRLVDGGAAVAEATAEAVYLAISIRNVGSGIAVLHGRQFHAERRAGEAEQPPLEAFTRLSRDLYLAARETGFWQGTFRDPSPPFAEAKAAVESGGAMTVAVLYGDELGGQRAITRFSMLPRPGGGYLPSVARHWNVDGVNPR